MVKYMLNLNNPSGRQEGQRHMLWGVIGLAIMLSAFGIVKFVFNSVTTADDKPIKGINGDTIQEPDILKQGKF